MYLNRRVFVMVLISWIKCEFIDLFCVLFRIGGLSFAEIKVQDSYNTCFNGKPLNHYENTPIQIY